MGCALAHARLEVASRLGARYLGDRGAEALPGVLACLEDWPAAEGLVTSRFRWTWQRFRVECVHKKMQLVAYCLGALWPVLSLPACFCLIKFLNYSTHVRPFREF